MDNELTPQQGLRLECMKLAVKYGTQRDMLHPDKLADIYFEWIMRDSLETSLADNRIDDSWKQTKNARSVRKG